MPEEQLPAERRPLAAFVLALLAGLWMLVPGAMRYCWGPPTMGEWRWGGWMWHHGMMRDPERRDPGEQHDGGYPGRKEERNVEQGRKPWRAVAVLTPGKMRARLQPSEADAQGERTR